MFIQRLAGGVFGALLLAGLLAGCGGTPSGPQVANLGAAASATTTTSAPTDPYARALAYSQCMRAHGVPNFPDPQRTPGGPNGGGGVKLQIQGGSGINPQSQQFQAAQRACQSLRPQAGKASTPADPTKLQPWADCIRHHGVPNLPDPTIVNGNVQINLTGTGIDPGSPQAQQAIQACKSLSPGGNFEIRSGNGGPGGGK